MRCWKRVKVELSKKDTDQYITVSALQ